MESKSNSYVLVYAFAYVEPKSPPPKNAADITYTGTAYVPYGSTNPIYISITYS